MVCCLLLSVRVIQDWGTEEVGQWLGCLGLLEYRDKFIANDIRGPELLHLGRTDLKVKRHLYYTLQDNLIIYILSGLYYIRLKII